MKKNLVEKSKTAKPKATKKNLVEKPNAVEKLKPVKNATKKDLVEKLNKKRIWKGGNADADELINILKDIKKDYFKILIDNIEAKNISASYDEFNDFVFHFFQNPSEYSIISYELITHKELEKLISHLETYGITTNEDVDNNFIKLISLFNIIRDIYIMNVAFNIKDFVDKMDGYKKDDNNFYSTLLSNTKNVWFITKSINHANSSSSIDPSVYNNSSSDELSTTSSLLRYGTISSNYRPK